MEDLERKVMKAIEASLSLAKWRLRPASKHRLHIDILALCTRMRAVVMVDYGGKMPELLERLCKVLKLMQKGRANPLLRIMGRVFFRLKQPLWKQGQGCVCQTLIYLGNCVVAITFAKIELLNELNQKNADANNRILLAGSTLYCELCIFQSLRVMVVEDMIYLIHAEGIAEFAATSLNSERKLLFVDLQQNPPKIIMQTDDNLLLSQLASIQKLFSLIFRADGTNSGYLLSNERDSVATNGTLTATELLSNSQSSEFVDLSDCMRDTQVTIPTLNGWLLGYPVIYLLSKEHIEDSIHNLSTKSLNLFKVISSRRNSSSSKGYQEDELLSFSVPYDLSSEGSNEPWAEVFEARMREKWSKCKHVWSSIRMEVSSCHPQAATIVL